VLDEKIILIGYSGHGFVVADTAIENQLKLVEYAENSIVQNNPFNLNYAGNECDNDFFEKNKKAKYLIGIGDNTIREKIYNLIIEKQGEILTLISQSASISKMASIGNGTFVNKNVAINALAKVGKNVILNTACIIEHDCVIADSVHIAPGAVLSGNVIVGERSFIGANSVIKQGITIGKDVVVGAGTVVLKNISDGQKIVGNPSRYI
jgi:sugar O-acyltransferase (sialic acid O-acetyltransferase NeuD family)